MSTIYLILHTYKHKFTDMFPLSSAADDLSYKYRFWLRRISIREHIKMCCSEHDTNCRSETTKINEPLKVSDFVFVNTVTFAENTKSYDFPILDKTNTFSFHS